MSKHYVNETGTDLILDLGVDIGTVAASFINYKKPGGTTGSWPASLYSSHSELAGVVGTYLLKRTLVYGDLDVSGEWIFQGYVAAATGTWWGEAVRVNIYGQFE